MAPPQKRAVQQVLVHLLIAKYFYNVAVRWIASLLAAIPPVTNHITELRYL
jgi:hypothetical protein